MDIRGTIALVTGANGDIGQWYIKALQQQGASRIYACDRELDALEQVISQAPHKIIPIVLDVTELDSIQAATKHCQGVSLLINNAGTELYKGLLSTSDFCTATAQQKTSGLEKMSMCRAFAPILKDNGGGAIINMFSLPGAYNHSENIPYSTAKTSDVAACPPTIGALKRIQSATHASSTGRLSINSPSQTHTLLKEQNLRNALEEQRTLVVDVCLGTIQTKNAPPSATSPAGVVQAALQGVINEVPQIYPG